MLVLAKGYAAKNLAVMTCKYCICIMQIEEAMVEKKKRECNKLNSK